MQGIVKEFVMELVLGIPVKAVVNSDVHGAAILLAAMNVRVAV